MGIPLAQTANPATGKPAAGDQANAVLSGSFAAVGVSQPFCFYGPMNLVLYASLVDALTTTAGSTAATVSSGTSLAAGQAINSVNVPPGTIATVVSGTNVTLSNKATVTGTDNAAFFTGAGIEYVGTIQLERCFDGGSTWIVCNIGGSGALAQWNTGTPVSLSFGEPERNVAYRLSCVAYSSGVINYRISETGQIGTTLSVPAMM